MNFIDANTFLNQYNYPKKRSIKNLKIFTTILGEIFKTANALKLRQITVADVVYVLSKKFNIHVCQPSTMTARITTSSRSLRNRHRFNNKSGRKSRSASFGGMYDGFCDGINNISQCIDEMSFSSPSCTMSGGGLKKKQYVFTASAIALLIQTYEYLETQK